MVLSDIDRLLLRQCLEKVPKAWEDFVDRFLGLVVHVVRHTAQSRMVKVSDQDVEDLAADVFLALVQNDFAALKRFRGHASLATYLTVISRRIVVRQLGRRTAAPVTELTDSGKQNPSKQEPSQQWSESSDPEKRIIDKEQVEQLLRGLNESEANVVRMYHLEGQTYEEISSKVGMPQNSVGPTLSRAREKMRRNP